MRALTLAFVPLLLLAGCSGSTPEGDGSATHGMDGSGPHGGHAAGGHLLAPEWKVGDYWTLNSPQGGTFTHAVSGDSGADWTMDTDSADVAMFDALDDISFLGKVRKSDLAGSQGDARVEFLRFPLQSNMTWGTTWDGEAMMVHVGEVADGKAKILAMRGDGTTYATYTYSDRARYFESFAFHTADGSAVAFEWTLQSSGASFGGQLVRWSLNELFASSGALPSGQATSFQVEPGYSDVYISATLDCSAGALFIAIGPPTGPAEERGYSAEGPCPLQSQDAYPVAAPAEAEQWGAILSSAPTTVGTLDLQVYGRTLAQFAAGAAPA